MVTIIDMITGEVIHSSQSEAPAVQPKDCRQEAWACPSLALQEFTSERRIIQMPPELAHITVAEFLGE